MTDKRKLELFDGLLEALVAYAEEDPFFDPEDAIETAMGGAGFTQEEICDYLRGRF